MKCLFALGTAEPASLVNASSPSPEGEGRGEGGQNSARSADFLRRSFGDYELLEEIARGGMGVVYKARQKSLGRIVAVKMLLFGEHADKEQAQRFRAEAAAAASLQHPNIVAIHEVSVHEGQPFFVMDCVEGQNLSQLSAECEVHHVDWLRRAARWVKTVAEAIHYAHERGILHRDLKPSNVLIDPFDQPRVTDFGLAKRLHHDSELTLSGQVLGSPNYMPPEQAAAKRGLVGRRSDVYSLGAILYHLLTGRPPFAGETLTDTLQEVLNREPVSPRLLNPSAPRDLETICLKCLEKEPSCRYQTALALAEDLDRYLCDEPIQAHPVGQAEKLWRWCRRKPVVASLGAATLVLLLTVVVGSPIAIYRINRERIRAEEARRSEAAARLLAETREKLTGARILCVQERWNEAKNLLKEISVQGLGETEKRSAAGIHAALAEGFAALGRWKQALPEAIHAVEYDPAEHMHYVSLLVLLAATGEFEEYRSYRSRFLNRFEKNPIPVGAGERIAKVSLLLTGSEAELLSAERLANTARLATQEHPFRSYKEFAEGLAQYRLGHFENAIGWMRKSINDPFYGAGQMRYVQSYMVLAMAQHRLDQREEARRALAEGLAIKEARLPKLESGYLGPDWYWRDWIIAEILSREAKEVIEGQSSTTGEPAQK